MVDEYKIKSECIDAENALSSSTELRAANGICTLSESTPRGAQESSIFQFSSRVVVFRDYG